MLKVKSDDPFLAADLKLSEGIRMAVDDVQKALEEGPYRPESEAWHDRLGEAEDRPVELCAICLAGGVIARTQGFEPGEGEFILPSDKLVDNPEGLGDMQGRMENRLRALDYARHLMLDEATRQWNLSDSWDRLDAETARAARTAKNRIEAVFGEGFDLTWEDLASWRDASRDLQTVADELAKVGL